MLVIGLTGGIGSGKSAVARLFKDRGITVIDADQLARDVVARGSNALQQIAAHFGEHVIDTEGNLRRAELRKLVFADTVQLQWLENLLHPLIADLIQSRIETCQSPYCILESPLLLETNQRQLVDRVLVVDASEDLQVQRTLARDNSDETTIRNIIAAQLPREARLAQADDVIHNEQDLTTLEAAVTELHTQYLNLAESRK